jgi:hypothetical protein
MAACSARSEFVQVLVENVSFVAAEAEVDLV